MSDVVSEGVEVGAAESAVGPAVLSGAAARRQRRVRPLLAAGGRAVVVLMALFVIAAAARPLDARGLLAVTLLAAIWLTSLRAASASAPVALGPRVPAAVGSVTGLVCVLAIKGRLRLKRSPRLHRFYFEDLASARRVVQRGLEASRRALPRLGRR